MAVWFEDILDFSVGQRPQRICKKSEVSEVVANPLAGLTAKTMHGNVSYLRNLVNAISGEMSREYDFTLPKLIEHLDMVLILHRLFVFITGKREGLPSGRWNFTPIVFTVVSGDDRDEYESCVAQVKDVVEQNVLVAMNELVERIMDQPDDDWASDIRTMLVVNAVPSLDLIHSLLGNLEALLRSSAERAADGFRLNLDALAADPGCH